MTFDDFESHEDPYVRWDAAYVLGAMSPSDRREYEAHLAHCAQCSQALSELAGMPGLLALITPEEAFGTLPGNAAPADAETPPPRVLTQLVGTVQRRRRHRRAATALAAAAAVIAVAVPVGVLVTQDRTHQLGQHTWCGGLRIRGRGVPRQRAERLFRCDQGQQSGHARQFGQGLRALCAVGEVRLVFAPIARGHRTEHICGVPADVGILVRLEVVERHRVTPISCRANRRARKP